MKKQFFGKAYRHIKLNKKRYARIAGASVVGAVTGSATAGLIAPIEQKKIALKRGAVWGTAFGPLGGAYVGLNEYKKQPIRR